MNHGSIDLTIEDIERLAAEVWDSAAKEALAKGLPVTGYHDGYLFRYQPGKGIEVFAPSCSDERACDAVPTDGTGETAASPEVAVATVEGAVRSGSVDDGRIDDDSAAAAASEVAPPVCEPAALAIDGRSHPDESLAEIGIKAIEFARQNANATLELTAKLFTAKSFAQVVALATAHAYQQFQALSAQSKDRAERVSEAAAETRPPKGQPRQKAVQAAGSEASAAP